MQRPASTQIIPPHSQVYRDSFPRRRLSVEDLERRERLRLLGVGGASMAATALAVLLAFLLHNPVIGALAVGGIAVAAAAAVWLWKDPVRAVYGLFGAAILLPEYPTTSYTDYISQALPFFLDLKSWSHIPLVFSLADIFIVLALAIWLLKGITERTLRFERGSLLLPIGLYMLLVLFAEVHGLTTGGDFRTSMWEVRGQAYMLVAYILACNLIRKRSQVVTLLWILVILGGIRGIDGTYHYIFWYRPLRAAGIVLDELYPHEQSYFFNGFLTLALIVFLYGGSRRMKRIILLLLPFVLVANLANQRRAAMAAMVVAVVVLLAITWVLHPRHRRVIALSVVGFALVFPPYYLMFQNSRGALALPARAFSTVVHPSTRDAASDMYRVIEEADIMATIHVDPIFGYGFGKEMLAPYEMANIRNQYEWQYVMPHNSILWVWMRLGVVGYLILWVMIGTAVMQAARLIPRLRDSSQQGLALFVLLMIIQQVIISYVDLQWSNYRTMIATGLLFALISRLAAFARTEETGANPSLKKHKTAAVPLPFAVVDGRLRRMPPRAPGHG